MNAHSLTDWNGCDTYTEAKKFRCGYCHRDVAAITGYGGKTALPPKDHAEETRRRILPNYKPRFALDQKIALCPHCAKPTFWDEGKQVPGIRFGDDVNYLPLPVERLYNEARACFSASAFTAGVMVCRTLLMHVAVSKGADPGRSFKYYTDFFEQGLLVPADCKVWIDRIRVRGNEATHEIELMIEQDLKTIIAFTGMLLKIVYEFPRLAHTQPGE